jgi:MFS family permease
MGPYQWTAVAVTVALCALDGFDVLAITLAAPGITKAWHISKAALGGVFSMGLFGMAAGSLLVAPLADLFGRRVLVLANLALMSLGMFLCAQASDVATLALWRVVTGLGIGATIAIINPLAAEYANAQRRDLAIGLMAVGFPIGGVLGGAASAYLLARHGWPAVFLLGAAVGAGLIPLVLWRLPEPVAFLIEKGGATALARVNAFLRRCGHGPVRQLPATATATATATASPTPGGRLVEIFRPGRLRLTLHVTAIYFLFVMTVYFFLSWIPQMVADLGFRPSAAAGVSATANLAGVVGGTLLGWAAARLGLKRLALVALTGMGLATMAFGYVRADLGLLTLNAAMVGFFLFGGMVGLYAIVSRTFPTHARATGSGFVIGVGRIGSALAPAAAGLLFSAGAGRGQVSIVMGAAAILAAGLLLLFPVGETSTPTSNAGACRPRPAI